MISVAAWVIDGGIFHIQDCKADSFLMAAHEGARLHATEFVVSTSSGAGTLLSSGEVTMRASVKQRCVGYVVVVVVCPCSACVQVAASSIRRVRRNSGPRRELCYSNSASLQRKETTQISSDLSCLSNVLKPKEAGTPQRYCQNIHGHFGFSFPSRANVVKVTHLNVTGSEALISWASEVPWHFKQRNVRSRSTKVHLRFPRLSKCQESTVYDMDCDEAFGGYNGSDGIRCTQCHPGSVFVKNITEKTIANRSAVQHCVPCPDGARICNATAIEMLQGCLVRKRNGATELCAVFPKASLMLRFWFRTVGVYSEEQRKGA